MHALYQCRLISIGQKGLKRVAGQKDQAELLTKVKRSSVTFHPTRRQTDRFAPRPLYHSWNDIQTSYWEPQLRNRDGDTPSATCKLKHRTTSFLRQRTIERHTGIAGIRQVIVDGVGKLFKIVVVDQYITSSTVRVIVKRYHNMVISLHINRDKPYYITESSFMHLKLLLLGGGCLPS